MKTFEELIEMMKKDSYEMKAAELKLTQILYYSKNNPSSRYFGIWEKLSE